MSDVVERAKAALEGITKGPWRFNSCKQAQQRLLLATEQFNEAEKALTRAQQGVREVDRG